MNGRLLKRILGHVGLEVSQTEDVYRIHFTQPVALQSVEAAGKIFAVAVLAVVSLLFLRSITLFPYYSPATNVEEVALMYNSAQNFIQYGFSNSAFLPDYSTSSDPADHPYAYNHMPPGPDIFIALLLKASGGSYRVVRLVFWMIFLSGMACYLAFARVVLNSFQLVGSAFAVLFLNPSMLLRNMDDPQYGTFPLLAFLPLVLLNTHYRTGKSWCLYLVPVVGLVSAVYLDYLSLLVVMCCWIFLYFTRLLRVDRKHLLGFLGAVSVGILLHLFQNFLYLGPALFFQELRLTVSNRILGIPSRDELRTFYQAIGLVHHGSQPIEPLGFLYHVWAGLAFPGRAPVAVAAVGILAWVVCRNLSIDRENRTVALARGEATSALVFFGRLAIWVGGTLVLPMLMLPAFTQEYGLHGTGLNSYFLAIAAIAIILYGLRQALPRVPRTIPRGRVNIWPPVIALVLLVVMAVGVWRAARWELDQFRLAVAFFRPYRFAELEDIRRYFRGKVYMTNINPVVVGFFAQEAGHGVCELAALPDTGDINPSNCHVSYMRRQDHGALIRPKYFFFFPRELYPGFANCLPSSLYPFLQRPGDECVAIIEQRLNERFERIYDNGLFKVFDLHSPTRS